jgi:ParB-like chromosome segregation protein Spo0J
MTRLVTVICGIIGRRMTQLRISDLLANSPVDPQAHLDAERVTRYAEDLDALPPIVVFDTGEGLLVADGYHRLAAARLRGKDTIEAEIRHGSRHDALRYAATVGAVQHGITADKAMEYIRRRSPQHWRGTR